MSYSASTESPTGFGGQTTNEELPFQNQGEGDQAPNGGVISDLNSWLGSNDIRQFVKQDGLPNKGFRPDVNETLSQVQLQGQYSTPLINATNSYSTPTNNSVVGSSKDLLAQANSEPKNSGVGNAVKIVGSFLTPEAVVLTNNHLNGQDTRNFGLVNLTTGSYTQFITHKGATTVIGGEPFKRVEGIHYNTNGTGTRREDGLGWGKKFGETTVFANIRAGDTNLVNSANGASVNVGIYGPPNELNSVLGGLERSGDPRIRAVAEVMTNSLNAASAGGNEAGFAWRGTLQYNKESKQLELNAGGIKVPLAEFASAFESLPATNEGYAEVARANNRDDYLGGMNPYLLADSTRTPQGEYRDHGDPVSAISGGITQLGEAVNPGLPPVRTNREAKQVLEEAIDRNFAPLTAEQRGLFGEDAANLRPDPLNASQRAKLDSTLALLDQYDLNFGSDKIKEAAIDAARSAGTEGKQPKDQQFVRDVYEGDFRYEFNERYDLGDATRDIVLGVNRWTAIATGLDAGPVARDDISLQKLQARDEGLGARLDEESGGVLNALGISDAGLSAEERDNLEGQVLAGLSNTMAGRVALDNTEPTAQALFSKFSTLSVEERQALGARLNVAASRN